MARPDTRRLRLSVGLLALAALALHVGARVVAISPITLAPVYMFSPLVAGLVVSWRHGIQFSTVGLRRGRPRWLAVAALGALPLVGLTLNRCPTITPTRQSSARWCADGGYPVDAVELAVRGGAETLCPTRADPPRNDWFESP